MAAPQLITCPKCGVPFPATAGELTFLQQCPVCARATRVYLFPAFARPAATGAAAQRAVIDGEATCFYHPQKRAHILCDNCGRFLCAMCDLDVYDAHLCPQCLQAGADKGRVKSLERSRVRYDQIVSSLLILPLVLCWFVLPVTSLVALGLVGWKWRAPGSLVDNTRVRFIIYSVVAILELVGSSLMWWFMVSSNRL